MNIILEDPVLYLIPTEFVRCDQGGICVCFCGFGGEKDGIWATQIESPLVKACCLVHNTSPSQWEAPGLKPIEIV